MFSFAVLGPGFALVPVYAAAPDPSSLNARAYVVTDVKTGQVIMANNPNLQWTPASLTKLVTALVVMDSKPKLTKSVAISKYDQSLGACGHGGDCIKAKPGVKFTVDGLFHAALLPSANNAASALARSTGLSSAQFAARMNRKAKALGATNSRFYEPTGMSDKNKITASDYSKIVAAAFSNPYLADVANDSSYFLQSTNNSAYNQTLKNTDKLLTSSDVDVVGAKTGYLGSVSGYNFASVVKTPGGSELAIVVLGEDHMYYAFDDTKTLAAISDLAKDLALR